MYKYIYSIVCMYLSMYVCMYVCMYDCRDSNHCKAGPYKKTQHEGELLSSSDLKIVSKLNRDEFERAVS